MEELTGQDLGCSLYKAWEGPGMYSTRFDLLQWMANICMDCEQQDETFFYARECLDRFMVVYRKRLADDILQDFGLACIFLSSKYHQVIPLSSDGLLGSIRNCTTTKNQLLRTERVLLKHLGFRVAHTTEYDVLGLMLPEDCSLDLRSLSLYLLYSSVLNIHACAFPREQLITAVVCLACEATDTAPPPGCSIAFSQRCCEIVKEAWRYADSHRSDAPFVQFKSPKRNEVAVKYAPL